MKEEEEDEVAEEQKKEEEEEEEEEEGKDYRRFSHLQDPLSPLQTTFQK